VRDRLRQTETSPDRDGGSPPGQHRLP
jgi:hypothetical protein